MNVVRSTIGSGGSTVKGMTSTTALISMTSARASCDRCVDS